MKTLDGKKLYQVDVIKKNAMRLDDNDINEIIEKGHRRDKFHKGFDIDLIFEYEYDEDSSEMKEEIVTKKV